MDNVARPCETFPSAPNWFGAAVSAFCSPLELYVYASRNRIIALNSNTLRVQNSFIASQHKLHAIAIHGTICATTGQDKAVRCWNLDNCKLENGHLRHQAEVNALCWAKKGTVLISGDKHGQLSIWDRSQDVIASKVHINNTIRIIGQTVIEEEDIIAVGYANGMIIVGKLNSLQQFEILYRLEHQIDEIQSLRWQHTQPFEQNTNWPKLASGSRDGSLVIWDVPNEDVRLKVSPPKDKQMTNNQQSRVFTVVAWSTILPQRLFYSSLNGDIIYIDIDKAVPKSNKYKRFTELHSRSVFGIDIVDDGRFAISHSMDRSVVKWDTTHIKKEFAIRTMGGIPYSMDISKEDVTKMAVALSDSNIKIWNVPISKDAFSSLSNAGDLYRSENIWKGLKGKITKLKWHPQNEGSLVFGTEHGSVSLIDTYSGKTTSFKSYHKGTVYSLDWVTSSDAFTLALQGNGSSQGPWVLSCDGRSVYVHDSMKPSKPAVNIDDAFREQNSVWIQSVQEKGISRCDVAVDNDTEMLALGNTDGSIEVYSLSNLKLLYTANNQTKTINCMAWKPKKDGQHSYLATGSADTTICAHYLGKADNINNLQDIPLPATTFVQVFKGHLEGITDITWQPGENENKLASSSSDGNILIWDLDRERPLNCIPSFIRVLSLCWSPTIPSTLFSGNEDHCIHVWKTDELRVMEENEQVIKKSINSVNWNRKMIAKPSKNGTVNASEVRDVKSVPAKRTADQQQSGRVTANARKKAKGNAENGIFTRLEASIQNASRISTCYECLKIAAVCGNWESIVEDMEKKALDRLGNLDTIKTKETLDACMKQSDLDTAGDPLFSALFESKNRVRDMMDEEVDTYNKTNTGKQISGVTDVTSKASFDPRILLDVMRNTSESIDASDSRNTMVTTEDWVALALAPMFSRELWEEKVVRLAAKLDMTNNPHGAVVCYLAAFQVYPAIDVYRRAKLYKEAIALAKLRLPEGSDIISELFNEWGAYLETVSQYEFAAKCYLQSKRAGYGLNALNALARPNDAVALYWSATIAYALHDSSASERFNLWIAELERQTSESTKE
ncbi:hypothetical protein K450DRAFT_245947 [Umbelopsis ramanniana AG]|uniref:WD40 repeat-like protein n=1 Tax=Umbelopsis ramanniana AG TaxID=1314678 RepID=A0AAD5E869_UMBRA|nr:uncharacterized protein K450DRAFT_245947 [Umbelopsis ramanniana AG]KAI8578664.1 hypothetical protein K450DRAFT_245947 [Umbelopsis ramanniana AG]